MSEFYENDKHFIQKIQLNFDRYGYKKIEKTFFDKLTVEKVNERVNKNTVFVCHKNDFYESNLIIKFKVNMMIHKYYYEMENFINITITNHFLIINNLNYMFFTKIKNKDIDNITEFIINEIEKSNYDLFSLFVQNTFSCRKLVYFSIVNEIFKMIYFILYEKGNYEKIENYYYYFFDSKIKENKYISFKKENEKIIKENINSTYLNMLKSNN